MSKRYIVTPKRSFIIPRSSKLGLPDYEEGCQVKCRTSIGLEDIIVLDYQARSTNYAYLVELVLAKLMLLAWPSRSSFPGPTSMLTHQGLHEMYCRVPIELNPNVDYKRKKFYSHKSFASTYL